MEVGVLAALVAALSVTVAGSVQGDQFLVDLEHATIGAVSPKDSVRQLRAKFGAGNVIRTVGRLEGSPNVTFVVSIAGHKVVQHWNYVSTSDSAFKTKEGVGVGSTVADFARYYGEALRGEGEGASFLNFRPSGGAQFQVRVSDQCFAHVAHLKADKVCTVREILL